MPFTFERLAIPGLVLIEPKVFGDARGFFMETYKRTDFASFGITDDLVQENQSRSGQGTLRGMHFQTGAHAQGKLVRVIEGDIFDVAVDLRPDSPTRGKWVGLTLSRDNRRMLYVPPMCAHGFYVLSDSAEVIYKTSTEYAPAHEAGVMWDDPAFGIEWPLRSAPQLSERDKHWPRFSL